MSIIVSARATTILRSMSRIAWSVHGYVGFLSINTTIDRAIEARVLM